MSTLKVDAIRHNSATSDAITTAADGTCTAKITSINDGALSNRNLLHNSSFEVWQRGTTFASGASGGNRYTADRWSVPRRTRAAQSTDVPAGFKYALLLDREQTGGAEPFTVSQGIEKDNIRFTGSYTLSFYAKSSDINSVNINVQDRTTVGEGGTNHSSIVTNQAVTITSSWARYTYTFTLSSIALSGTCLRISIGNTSADQNDELLLTGIQLETGTTATDIEKRSIGHELSLCQRYCYADRGSEDYHAVAQGHFNGSSTGITMLYTPVNMRAAPTLAYPVGTWIVSGDSGTINPSNIYPTDNIGGVNAFQIRTAHSGGQSGEGFLLRTSSAGHTWILDAEL
tara:strand:- start:183 stop:1211 length:1029 start_codon:yes stop_codon:yes gene_type:complete